MTLRVMNRKHQWKRMVELKRYVEPHGALLQMNDIRPEIVKLLQNPAVPPDLPQSMAMAHARDGNVLYSRVELRGKWRS